MNKSVDSVHSLKCYESLARLSMSPLDQLTILDKIYMYIMMLCL